METESSFNVRPMRANQNHHHPPATSTFSVVSSIITTNRAKSTSGLGEQRVAPRSSPPSVSVHHPHTELLPVTHYLLYRLPFGSRPNQRQLLAQPPFGIDILSWSSKTKTQYSTNRASPEQNLAALDMLFYPAPRMQSDAPSCYACLKRVLA